VSGKSKSKKKTSEGMSIEEIDVLIEKAQRENISKLLILRREYLSIRCSQRRLR